MSEITNYCCNHYIGPKDGSMGCKYCGYSFNAHEARKKREEKS